MRAFALIAAALIALPAMAETAPGDVQYDNGAVAQSLTGTPGNVEDGKKVYATKSLGNCVACHKVSSLPDVQWQGTVGPALDGVAERWNEAQLRGIVANAKHTFPGTMMPAFYKVDGFIRPGDAFTGKAATEITPLLTAQQIEDVVAFLATLKE